MAPESDDELIGRAVAGDRQALERLFRRHYPTIHAFAQKICGDPVLAEDVAQDAVVKLMGSIQTFDHRCAFTSWLYRVVLTKALDHRRKEKRRSSLAEELRQAARRTERPCQEDSVTARQLWDLILELPTDERDAAVLVLGEGLTHREAAEILGCPLGTVGWRLSKIVKRLKKTLTIHDHEPEDSQRAPKRAEDRAAVA